ncbi:hypothetical protein [uncultured Christiangramia sp.]|uniref:hypothetical protein n=1 Tax=Christiangramia sp. 3-2217-3z TaxID=3417564 RepID=UPI00260B99F8|nr:hypothetical protein [uncultured Christiangramia sp.]
MYKRVILISILFLLFSCDCQIGIQGQILSANTNKPIHGAKIEMIDREIISFSNRDGFFGIGEMTGFCYNPKIRVTYKNYKPFEIELSSDLNETIFKIKEESEYIDLDKPYYPNPENKRTSIGAIPIENYSRNFKVINDSLFIYLDKENLNGEIDSIKQILSKRYQ